MFRYGVAWDGTIIGIKRPDICEPKAQIDQYDHAHHDPEQGKRSKVHGKNDLKVVKDGNFGKILQAGSFYVET